VSDHPWPFTYTDEVRFSDLDLNGHLNNVAFLVFLESARFTYIRGLYPEGDPTRTGFGILIAEMKITYRSSGFFGERIDTRLRADALGRTSFRIDFEMDVGDRLLADGYSAMVVYDRVSQGPVPIPATLRERLAADGARERERPTPRS
jgi:acyl-CoA thioester hydrolase